MCQIAFPVCSSPPMTAGNPAALSKLLGSFSDQFSSPIFIDFRGSSSSGNVLLHGTPNRILGTSLALCLNYNWAFYLGCEDSSNALHVKLFYILDFFIGTEKVACSKSKIENRMQNKGIKHVHHSFITSIWLYSTYPILPHCFLYCAGEHNFLRKKVIFIPVLAIATTEN